MLKNTKMIRWLVPVCLLILLSILLLAVNYTASAGTPDLSTMATAVSYVHQTATAQAHKQPHVEPTKTPIPAPTHTP